MKTEEILSNLKFRTGEPDKQYPILLRAGPNEPVEIAIFHREKGWGGGGYWAIDKGMVPHYEVGVAWQWWPLVEPPEIDHDYGVSVSYSNMICNTDDWTEMRTKEGEKTMTKRTKEEARKAACQYVIEKTNDFNGATINRYCDHYSVTFNGLNDSHDEFFLFTPPPPIPKKGTMVTGESSGFDMIFHGISAGFLDRGFLAITVQDVCDKKTVYVKNWVELTEKSELEKLQKIIDDQKETISALESKIEPLLCSTCELSDNAACCAGQPKGTTDCIYYEKKR